jgi:hypothetical protein
MLERWRERVRGWLTVVARWLGWAWLVPVGWPWEARVWGRLARVAAARFVVLAVWFVLVLVVVRVVEVLWEVMP